MRRLLLVGLLVLIVSLGLRQESSAQQSIQTPQTSPVSIQATTVAELRTWDAFVTDGSRSGSLRLRRVDRDPLLPARLVERFDQFHDGVRIWGADVVRDSERGVPLSIFGELSPTLQLSTDPAISEDGARTALLRLGGADALLLGPLEVVIARLDSGDHRLAYTAVVSGSGDVVRAFVDAQTGAELLRYTEVQRQQAAVGSGRGTLGDQKKVSVEARPGVYVAVDRLRPPTIRTFDLGGGQAGLDRYAQILRGAILTDSELARVANNVWTDPAVLDAQAHVGMAYDYFYKRQGRTGIDGRNGPINIVANALTQPDALRLPMSDWGDLVSNANWCAPCFGGQGRLWFGNGMPAGIYYRDTNTTYTAGALDTVAHELTHAVTTFTSNLAYRNESGALNEAFSDMMGKGVEFFYHPPGGGVGQADYVFSKDTDRARPPSSLHGIRSLANPELYNQPDHYSRYRRLPDTPAGDNGGVHANSGIPNHAFFLAIEGGTNRTSLATVQGVGGANRAQIEQVFFRAFTLLLPASATFSMARIATIQAARDLYGATVERAVTQAWDAVGVTDTSSSFTRMTTVTGTLPAQTYFGPDPRYRLYYYIVTMPATGRYQAVLNWSDSSVDLDIMIGRPGCLSYSCMMTIAESATRRPEAVCADVRAGEQYWVLLENWSPRSTSFQLGQSISFSSGNCGTLPTAAAVITDAGTDKGGRQAAADAEQSN